MTSPLALVFFGSWLVPSFCQAEPSQAAIAEVRSCGEVETNKDGGTTVIFNKDGARDVFCNTVLKVFVPKGYRLQSELKSRLTVSAGLFSNNDKLFLLLKVQSADLVDKVLKSVVLSSESPSLSLTTLSGEVTLPELGSCEKDREAYLAFASTARVVKAGDNEITASLVKLEIPALNLIKLDCPSETGGTKAQP